MGLTSTSELGIRPSTAFSAPAGKYTAGIWTRNSDRPRRSRRDSDWIEKPAPRRASICPALRFSASNSPCKTSRPQVLGSRRVSAASRVVLPTSSTTSPTVPATASPTCRAAPAVVLTTPPTTWTTVPTTPCAAQPLQVASTVHRPAVIRCRRVSRGMVWTATGSIEQRLQGIIVPSLRCRYQTRAIPTGDTVDMTAGRTPHGG